MATDPQTNEPAALFHPRLNDWAEHFRWEGMHVIGLTATGRATVAALETNRPIILAIREEEAALGRHPEKD